MLEKSTETNLIEPADCTDMTEVRAGVDAVDQALVVLLGRRFAYMDAAARVKPNRTDVRDEVRKAQVLDNVKLAAAENEIPVEFATALWDRLVEASIAYELKRWDEQRRKG